MMKCIRPKYFQKFKCDGKNCGSRCCKGWRVVVDESTYKKYSTQKEILTHLEKFDDKNFLVKMKNNFECPFLDDDYLCKIQKNYGEDFLTAICYSYPRVNYKLGEILEQSLTLTCPVAAKLILYPNEKIEFETIEIDEPRGIFDWSRKLKISVEELIELQMTAIKILQDRNFSFDERLFNLCRLFGGDCKFEKTFDIQKYSTIMIDIFSEMYNANMDEQKKLKLQNVYVMYHKIILSRLMKNYSHIFENYMVNEFFMRCYPIAFDNDFWTNCKIFVTAYKAMEFATILTAISKNGFVTVEEFLMMIDAVNEKLDHNRKGMTAIKKFSETADDLNKFSKVMFQK